MIAFIEMISDGAIGLIGQPAVPSLGVFLWQQRVGLAQASFGVVIDPVIYL